MKRREGGLGLYIRISREEGKRNVNIQIEEVTVGASAKRPMVV